MWPHVYSYVVRGMLVGGSAVRLVLLRRGLRCAWQRRWLFCMPCRARTDCSYRELVRHCCVRKQIELIKSSKRLKEREANIETALAACIAFKTTIASLFTNGAIQHVVRCTIPRLLGHAKAENVVFEEVRTRWAVHVSPVHVSHCPRGILHDSRMVVVVRPRYVSTANAHYHIQ